MSYSLNDYQKDAARTAGFVDIGHPVVYPTLGLVGEAGEVAEKVKKIFRDHDGQVSKEYKEMLTKELGDVLWYLSQVAAKLDLTLEEVAKANIEKLTSRKARNKISGDGDDR